MKIYSINSIKSYQNKAFGKKSLDVAKSFKIDDKTILEMLEGEKAAIESTLALRKQDYDFTYKDVSSMDIPMGPRGFNSWGEMNSTNARLRYLDEEIKKLKAKLQD